MSEGKIVAIDFETYFDQDYSLRKLSTSEYIRNERFEAMSMSWSEVGTPDAPTAVGGQQAIEHALTQWDWNETALLCHHTQFDGLILSHHFGIVPAYYMDTLSMMRSLYATDIGGSLNAGAERFGLQPKLEGALNAVKGKRWHELTMEEQRTLLEYNAHDTGILEQLFQRLVKRYPAMEMDIIDVTCRMFCNPVLQVDIAAAAVVLQREQEEKEALACKAHEILTGYETDDFEKAKKLLNSNDKLAKAMEKKFGEQRVPMKWSDKQQKFIPAFAKTDPGWIALTEADNEDLRLVCSARQRAKSALNETRAARLITHALPALPVYLKHYGARTGRWSAGDKINLQNLPSRDGVQALRRCILPPPGHSLVVVDSSQIEARVLAWLARQTDLVEVFREFDRGGPDPYKLLACKIFGIPLDDITDSQRFIGKVGRLGLGYGMGAPKLQTQLETGAMGKKYPITLGDATKIVNVYRQDSRAIVDFWAFLDATFKRMAARQQNKKTHKTMSHWGGRPVQLAPVVIDGVQVVQFVSDEVIMADSVAQRYPDLRYTWDTERDENQLTYQSSSRGVRSKIYGGKACENIVQKMARNVVAWQAAFKIEPSLRLWKKSYPRKIFQIALLVHDEVVAVVPTEHSQAVLHMMRDAMSTSPPWARSCPISAEGGVRDNYAKQ